MQTTIHALPSAWIATGARSRQMFCGAEKPALGVIHGNDAVQKIEPLYSQETLDDLRRALKWTRVAAESATSCYGPKDTFQAGDESKTLQEILDMADAALQAWP